MNARLALLWLCLLTLPAQAEEIAVADSAVEPVQSAPKSQTEFAKLVCTTAEGAAKRHGLDKDFLIRLLYKESLFDPNAISPKGAQGLAQFMPGTAAEVGLDDPFDPAQAVRASAKYLSGLKRRFGNLGLAAAAYNGGEGRVDKWLKGIGGMPLETQDYVAFITGREVIEWRDAATSHPIPGIGAAKSFRENCVRLASRKSVVQGKRVAVRSNIRVSVEKLKPWGSLLTADFNEGRALAMYHRLKIRFPDKFRDVKPQVTRARNLSRGSKLMALVMVGANSRDDAIARCRSLVSENIPCVVRSNTKEGAKPK